MGFVCPICQGAGTLQITHHIELPSELSWGDELALQLLACSACGFRGAASYVESRRGALESEAVAHSCYRADVAAMAHLEELIKVCPAPHDTHCQCPAHRAAGACDREGRWQSPVPAVSQEMWELRWAGDKPNSISAV